MEILKLLCSFIGTKEGTEIHKDIVDGYNKIKPLPRGYKVTYKDSWCATFVSYIFYILGIAKFPFECSCNLMMQAAQKAGLWVESDSYTPKAGDCVLYDWRDNGIGDCKGNPDHIGIVESCTASGTICVIEGNYNNAVGRRYIKKNGRYIRGFIKSSTLLNTEKVKTTTSKKITKKVVDDVISGKYGNGDERKSKLKAAGYDPDAVQKKVNERLKNG